MIIERRGWQSFYLSRQTTFEEFNMQEWKKRRMEQILWEIEEMQEDIVRLKSEYNELKEVNYR